MKTTLGWILAILITLVLIAGLTWFGLGMNRVTQPFAAETSRLTESNSRNRVDGVNATIVSYCTNMRLVTDVPTKKAFATFIVNEAGAFQRQGLLTPQAMDCIAEAQGLIR